MKRVVTIQDISCLGKCSLTVALPIISACGVETCIIPTAVLSTHTMFSRFTFKDLTDEMPKIKDHWIEEGFKFDALYTGYLGSERQLEIVKDYFNTFKTNENLIIVDPVMADNGKMYKGFSLEFAKKMAKLCGSADIIVPNLTEACFMLDEEYIASDYSEEYIKSILIKLSNLGARYSLLTGVSFQKDKIGVMGYDKETKEFFSYYNNKVDAQYHGTGDIFSSSFTGAIVSGKSMLDSIRIAADYTRECIAVTKEDKDSPFYGVYFEQLIPYLIELMK